MGMPEANSQVMANSPRTVSYTHLDVYKRQSWSRATPRITVSKRAMVTATPARAERTRISHFIGPFLLGLEHSLIRISIHEKSPLGAFLFDLLVKMIEYGGVKKLPKPHIQTIA